MRVYRNPFGISSLQGVRSATESLYSSMRKLSSGERVNRPGDAPADFGISQMLRNQIRNGNEATRNIEKARSLISSADGWMQEVHGMLQRMSELAIASADSSKQQGDRDNLDIEFQQLKEEISRISREATFNGVQVAGRDQILSYNQDQETFVFSQLDGSESYPLNVKMLSGLQGTNGQEMNFDPTKDFTLSQDGKSIFYVDSSDNLVRYGIDHGTIARDTSDTKDKAFEVDAEGRLWYATETATGAGTYSLRQQDINTWQQDTTIVTNTDIVDMAAPEFSVYENRVYYADTNGDVISRDLVSLGDQKIELAASDMTFATTAGQFALSEDGTFMADVPAAGKVRVTNMVTKNSTLFEVGNGITVSDLTFSVDSRDVMFVDSTDGSIHGLGLTPGDKPMLSDVKKITEATGVNGFVGLSLDGGSHRANFRIHDGPDASHETTLTAGDVRLHTLGITKATVANLADAEKALGMMTRAVDRLSVQRARLGAEESRMEKTYNAMQRYIDSVDTADQVLRSVDVAAESANLAEAQVRQQAAIAILAQASDPRAAINQLLQGR
jgi:flagellin